MTTRTAASLSDIWVYLAPSPLFGLTLTLVVYLGALWLYERCGRNALASPVMVAIVALVVFLTATRTDYQTYFEGAQLIHFLLGPVTVALAIPLYANIDKVRRLVLPLTVALLVGCCVAALSAIGIAAALKASLPVIYSLAPKSATTPVAMGVAEQIGGIPSLTAVLVLLTGMIGALIGPALLTALRSHNDAVRGFSLGLAAHGFGTARAFQMSEVAGAFSGLAMGLNAVTTALLLPYLLKLVGL